ncbi:MAG: RnfABCDGE type electron transport complex subunit D [Treponema sp.]|nr:RnfABCDGE type electron transport complex subunit D [Candidatus Treponema caballi]
MKKSFEQLTLAPFCYSVPSVGQSCKAVIILFVPQLIMLFLTQNISSLILAGTAIVASIIADIVDSFVRNNSYKLTSSVVLQGLLIGMFIPSTYSPFKAFVLIFITLLLAKYAFGGFAQSWANPAAVTVIVLYLFGYSDFPKSLVDASLLQGTDTLTRLINQGKMPLCTFDADVTSFLNTKLFHYAGVVLPDGYVSLFWDTGNCIPALRFNLLTLLSTIYLISFNLTEWLIPFVYLFTYSLAVRIFGLVPYGNIWFEGDIILALCTSGTFVAAFFILPWGGTTPMTIVGKCIYSALAGIFAFLLNGCGTGNIGTMFVILIVNIFSPVIQLIEDWIILFFINKKQKVEE